MSGVLILDRSQTRSALSPTQLQPAITTALIAISRGEVSAPPRIAAFSPSGLLGAMPAYVPGLGLAGKLVSIFPSPGVVVRRSHRGIVALFDDQDGRLLALMDAESITIARTAAVAMLAMRALAHRPSKRIAVVGTGEQAKAQVKALSNMGTPATVVVGGRSLERARETASLHPSGSAGTIMEAVKGADVVFCCTDAREPVVRRSWFTEGAHISSIGGTNGPEIDEETVQDAAVFVEWEGAATSPPPAGAYELQGLSSDRVTLLGLVLDNQHPGRQAASELTLFKSTGHAALDTAAASVAYAFALKNGVGSNTDLCDG